MGLERKQECLFSSSPVLLAHLHRCKNAYLVLLLVLLVHYPGCKNAYLVLLLLLLAHYPSCKNAYLVFLLVLLAHYLGTKVQIILTQIRTNSQEHEIYLTVAYFYFETKKLVMLIHKSR